MKRKFKIYLIFAAALLIVFRMSVFAADNSNIVVGVDDNKITVMGSIENNFINNTLSVAVTEKNSGEYIYLGSFGCMSDGSFRYTFEFLPETEAGIYNISLGRYGKSKKIYDSDIFYNPSAQEEDEAIFSWCQKTKAGTISPDSCTFYIYLKDGAKNGRVRYKIDGGGEEMQNLAGDYTYINIPGLKIGNHTIEVFAEADGVQKISHVEDFAVMREYTHQFMDEFNNRGVVTHYAHNTMQDIDADFMDAAGIKTIREGIKWSVVETAEGFDWTATDRWVNQISGHGIGMTSIFGFNNYRVYTMYNHYNGEKVDESNYIPRKQKDIEIYNNYVQKTLERYPHLDKFELWNEPNADTGLAAADYTDLLMNTSVLVKNKNRFADISALSLFGFREMEWTQENFTSGMYPYMTAVAFHPYVQGAPDTGSQEERYEEMYQMIADNGGWKNMNITENGWSTFEYGVSPEDAAVNLVKQNILSERYDLIGNYWYDLIDDGEDMSNREHFFGIISNSRKPKPAYFAYAQLNEKLAGSIYMGEIKQGSARIFVYAKDGLPTLVAWAPDGEETIFAAGDISVEDIYGNALNSVYGNIHLTNSPVYIKCSDKSWFKTAAKNEIARDAENWIIKYSRMMPILADKAETLFSADISNMGEGELGDLHSKYKSLGMDILAEGKNGSITQMQTSSALYELYRVMRLVNRLYITCYSGAKVESLDAKMAEALEYSNNLYYGDGNIMQYSEELLRYAHNFYENAKIVLESGEANPIRDGVLSGWDMMAQALIDWFYEFSSFEEAFNYGLLMNIELTNNSFIDTAQSGKEKNMAVYVTNKSDKPFNGKLMIYDTEGTLLFTSNDIKVAENQYKYVETSFIAEKTEVSERALYTLVLTDVSGNIAVRRQHEIKVYSSEVQTGYPDHEGQGNYGNDNFPRNEDMSARAVESSDEDRIFEVDGKRFVLLDKDKDGNYFVAADDHYGLKGFNLVLQTQENTDMLRETGKWKYDTGTETNIAYWLNNEFLRNGNTNSGVNYKLPQAIMDNMLEREWTVEYAEDAEVDSSYKVKSKLALMSATEWNYYSDRLGYTPYKAPYAYPVNGKNTYIDENGARVNTGWWLRTAFNQEEADNLIYGSYITVYRYNTQPGLVAGWSVRSSAQTKYIRPVFWLDADFFEKIKVSSAGRIVRSEIAKSDLTSLLKIYTKEELLEFNEFMTGLGEDKTKINIIAPEDTKADVIAAGYDEDGRLSGLNINTLDILEGFGEYAVELPEVSDEYKIFVWNSLNKMEPAAELQRYN